jgi:hypothetical protein
MKLKRKHPTGGQIKMGTYCYQFNCISCKKYASVKILSRDILAPMLIKESCGGINVYAFLDMLYTLNHKFHFTRDELELIRIQLDAFNHKFFCFFLCVRQNNELPTNMRSER